MTSPPSCPALVCIVDDDAFVRAATSSLVRAFGWEAACFASAADFLDRGDAMATKCLVCDIQMPGMDGIELLAHLQDAGARIPTLFITALTSVTVRDRAMRQGAVCVIEKPIDAGELEAWLQRAISA